MNPLVNIAIEAARSAGRLIIRAFERPDLTKITYKTERDFFTDVDRRSEKIIIDTIRKVYPEHAVIAEESGASGQHDFTWIIDPLDGTRNFTHNIPHFAISIAVRVDDRVEHGVIYDPVRDELFIASAGRGAQLNGKRIRMAQQGLAQALMAFSYANASAKESLDLATKIAKLAPNCGGIRYMGSAALDLAYLAAGRLDGYFANRLNLWDYAAGVLLIQEAGGFVTNWQGDESLENGQLIAAHPKLFKQIFKAIG